MSQPPPGYGPPPGYSTLPGYSAAPGYGGPPGYGAAPGYGGPSGYGAAPGSGGPPAYGAAPGYGGPPAYGAAPGYGGPPAYSAPPPFPPPPARSPWPPLAEWWQRVLASLVDSAVSSGPQLVGLFVLLATLEERTLGFEGEPLTLPWPSAPGMTAFVLGTLASTAISVWNRWLTQGRTGQSVGKRLLGLRVVGEATMAPPGIGGGILRELCHVLDAYSYVGYFWPLVDARRRTFADMVMHTVVVQVPGQVSR